MSVRFAIDSLDFVRNAGIHHGKIPVDALVRLHDFLFDKEGELIYQISGQFDKHEKPGLRLEIKGKIYLSCQRCLGKLPHTIDLQTFLVLAKTEAELDQADEDEAVDAILATPDMDINDVSKLMANKKVRRLPVVENNKVVGMVSIGDFATNTFSDIEASEALTEISK